ncbi:hypothetical protein AGMMS4957_22210 [Bacteroidia bacterium]|nr:hypothetical protein AGMMS4957_22210 [Bacteroidia bacterium]
MKTNEKQIAALLDKYFEGLTSLEEEQTLRDYFQKDTIPEALKVYQPIFQYFASCHCGLDPQSPERRVPVSDGIAGLTRNDSVRWILAIAASLLLLITVRLAWNVPETSQAYIDGQKQADIAVMSSQIDAIDLFLGDN